MILTDLLSSKIVKVMLFITISVVLLSVHASFNVYAQQQQGGAATSGAATSGAATGGAAISGGITMSGSVCNQCIFTNAPRLREERQRAEQLLVEML